METTKIKLTVGDDNVAKLCNVTDPHVGQRYHDKKPYQKNVKWLEKEKEYQIILGGDMIECATRQYKEDQIMTIDEQIDAIVEDFQNIAEEGRIWGIIQGNHEYRGIRDAGMDPAYQMAKRLNIPYLRHGRIFYVNVKSEGAKRGQNYIIYAIHGNTGASTITGRTNAVLRMDQVVSNADLYLMGHVHTKGVYERSPFFCDRGNTSLMTQTFVLCGHYLQYEGSYAERRGYAPSCPSGSPRIRLHADKKEVTVKL